MNGVSFSPHSFSDLDFADDVALLAELIDLLVPALETMASEASSLGLEVNWQKTKVQALGSREDEPLTITAQWQEVAVVEEYVYLGCTIHVQFSCILYVLHSLSLIHLTFKYELEIQYSSRGCRGTCSRKMTSSSS